MAAPKHSAVIILCLALAIIIPSAFMLSQTSAPGVCGGAQEMLAKFTVKVYDEADTPVGWVTYNLAINKPYVRILHYHEGGFVLSTTSWRTDAKWQLCVGTEDLLTSEGQGDFCDVIIKIALLLNGKYYFEIGCLGGFRKQVFYDGTLKLDTATSRWTYFGT